MRGKKVRKWRDESRGAELMISRGCRKEEQWRGRQRKRKPSHQKDSGGRRVGAVVREAETERQGRTD